MFPLLFLLLLLLFLLFLLFLCLLLFLLLLLLLLLPSPAKASSLNVMTTGYPITGSTDFTLICSFILNIQPPSSVLNTSWVDTNNSTISSTSNYTQTSDSITGSVVLHFTELLLTDAGQYKCVITTQDSVGIITMLSQPFTVAVQGEIMWVS